VTQDFHPAFGRVVVVHAIEDVACVVEDCGIGRHVFIRRYSCQSARESRKLDVLELK
jgi:hypothetical protein